MALSRVTCLGLVPNSMGHVLNERIWKGYPPRGSKRYSQKSTHLELKRCETASMLELVLCKGRVSEIGTRQSSQEYAMLELSEDIL